MLLSPFSPFYFHKSLFELNTPDLKFLTNKIRSLVRTLFFVGYKCHTTIKFCYYSFSHSYFLFPNQGDVHKQTLETCKRQTKLECKVRSWTPYSFFYYFFELKLVGYEWWPRNNDEQMYSLIFLKKITIHKEFFFLLISYHYFFL